ncbi:hypothetical protein Mapa_007377 [Marchantia paleacea]|nr:hypothetical protein Mapa_007377 [Marchantia paleacea]
MDPLVGLVAAAIVSSILASILLDWWVNIWLPSKRLPPGPKPWPLVGSLLQIRGHGASFLKATQKLESKYGKTLTFWVGQRPVIVINDPQLAHEALIKQGATFSTRCMLSSVGEMTRGFCTVNTTPHGPFLNTIRRNLIMNVLTPKALNNLKVPREATLADVIGHIRQSIAENGGSTRVNVSTLVRLALFKYALYMCFGMQVEEKVMMQIDKIMHARVRSTFSVYVGDYIPVWRLVEWKHRRNLVRQQQELQDIILPIIQRIRELKGSGEIIPGTYVETLLKLQETDKRLRDEGITCFCNELITASTHTVASAVQSGMSMLSENQEFQSKLLDEIDCVVGNKPVEETHLTQMPYLTAFGKEVLRRHPPAVTALPHAVVEPCKLGIYDIPTNAVIYFHIDAYHQDPTVWPDPGEFRPERFLEAEVDFSCKQEVKLMPFGAGRRICPGINLGVMEMSMMIARMLQNFEWTTDEIVSQKEQVSALSKDPRSNVSRHGALTELAPSLQSLKKANLIARIRQVQKQKS